MEDIFSANARHVHFNRVVAAYHVKVVSVIQEVDEDIRTRGSGALSSHPRIAEILKLPQTVVDELMGFDSRHAEYAKARFALDGTWDGIYPFCEEHESHLVNWLTTSPESRSRRIFKESKRLTNPGGCDGYAKQVADEIAYEVHRFYGEQRVFFDLSVRKAGMGVAGLERTSKSSGKTGGADQSGAESGALGAQNTPSDPNLTRLVSLWPTLPQAIKAGILAMVQATQGGTA